MFFPTFFFEFSVQSISFMSNRSMFHKWEHSHSLPSQPLCRVHQRPHLGDSRCRAQMLRCRAQMLRFDGKPSEPSNQYLNMIFSSCFFEFSRAEVLPGRVSGASFHTFMLTFRCYRAVSTEKCQRIAWRRRQRPVQADHTFPFFLIFCFFQKIN